MSSQIKGLNQFIADLRTSSTQEAERARVQAELASVRKRLASSKNSKDSGLKGKKGYECRKIVSKLLYIYILGYDVDLGTEEIATLLNMPKFAEKQVGYLALGMFLHAQHDLWDQVEPIIIADLRSTKEAFTSLALNYISSWDCTRPISDGLIDLVYQLMVSPTSSTAVVKKAALTFTNFFRHEHQRIMSDPEWSTRVERILAILAGPNLGVATSLVSLLTEIASRSPEPFEEQAFVVVVRKLEEVYDGDGADASEYRYYQIFAPWLVAKLCRLLRVMFTASSLVGTQARFSELALKNARRVASSILSFCVEDFDGAPPQLSENSGSQQRKSACNIMFFDAMLLGNVLNLYAEDRELTNSILLSMKNLLSSKETNSRYFALQILQNLDYSLPKAAATAAAAAAAAATTATSAQTNDTPKKITELVLHLVKDRDISVRRQALDALSCLVDQHNVESVAAELLDLLVASDLLIRPLMVARLAVLIERFATSHEWYFDTGITLLEIGGTYAGEEVWQRLVQVVVNNPALQPYAVQRIYETLSASGPHSGHAQAANPCAHSDAIVKLGGFILGEFGQLFRGDVTNLFLVLQDQISAVPWQSKVILLNAYMKFATKFPQMRPAIVEAISMYTNSPNLETQQRANEYLRLLRPENHQLLHSLNTLMPPFGAEISAQLFQQMGRQAALRKLPSQTTGIPTHKTGTATASATGAATGAATPSASSTLLVQKTSDSASPLAANSTGTSLRQIHLSSNWEFGFKRMLTHSEAVLYQDALLQIGCRYSFHQAKGRLILYLKNISSFDLSSVSFQVKNPMSEDILAIQVQEPISAAALPTGRVLEQVITCEAKQPFALVPTCRITYLAGSFCETNLKLPITLERFMTPSAIDVTQFQQRWDQVGPEFEFTKRFTNYSATRASRSVEDDSEILIGLQYGYVKGSPRPTIYGAGILHTSQGGMFGTLIAVQPDAERNNYQVSVRATRKKLAAVVLANDFAQAYQL